MDFEANSKFVWFYVPDISGVDCAEMLLLNPVGPDVTQSREQMERLAAEVIPRLSD